MSEMKLQSESGKKSRVREMFDRIAPRYDLLNRLLSGGIDQAWRRKAVNVLKEDGPGRILDVATGTADLAIMASALHPEKIVGVDIAEEMLQLGREKIRRRGLEGIISLQSGDAERLPFSDRQFDAAMVAFGVRNFESLTSGLVEIHRVLRRGGRLVVLEFSRPRAFPVKQLYGVYGRRILPLIGRIVSGDPGAYTYLPESIQAFPDGEDFLTELRRAGFVDASARPLTFGIASIYTGRVG